MIFRPAVTMDDLIKAFMVRAIVFIGEQKCHFGEEIDEYEYSSLHFVGEIDGEPIATARLRFPGAYAKLERIAVRREWRGKGFGHALVDYLIEQAELRGFTTLKMHAQAHLADFYARHGFVRQGEIFQEAGIDHYLMVRQRM